MKNWNNNLIKGIVTVVILTSCNSPSSTTKVLPTPNNIVGQPTETAKPIPTATLGICPPYYSEPEEVLRLNLSSDLYGMVSADFNDDGFPDVVLYRGYTHTEKPAELVFLLNDGSSNLVVGTTEVISGTIPSVIGPRELVLADFNGDNRPDIFVADEGMDAAPMPGAHNTLVLSATNGKMVDASENLAQAIDITHSAAAADIDSDGDVDLYIGNTWGQVNIQPAIYLNTDGTGLFTKSSGRLPYPLEDLDFGAFTTSEFIDVNNDTFPDLILGDAGDDLEGGQDSYVLLNNGVGYFKYLNNAIPPKPWSDTNTALDIDAADLNADGYQDLFIVFSKWEYRGRYIQILINNQDGTFRDETATRLPQSENNDPWISFLHLVDINKDKHLDIVTVPSIGAGEPLFFLNNGDGLFHSLPNIFNIETEMFTFIDIDQNGYFDVLWATTYPKDVYYINRSQGCSTLDQ
jgi:hypothetical protein